MIEISFIWAKLCKKIVGSAKRDSRIHKTSRIGAGSNIVNTTIDKYTYCGYNCTVVNCDIGAFTSISDYVSIGDVSHPTEWVGTSSVFYANKDSIRKKFSTHAIPTKKRTYIGNDVYIGKNVLIKEGVTIGNGAVVGMGSVVTKDVEEYTIVAGCPAKVIKKRFNDIIIEKLTKIKWWEFDDERLRMYAQYFTEPEKFISEVEKP